MSVRHIRIDEFDYNLPEDRIALHPLEKRDACKLLVANAPSSLSHHVFSDLPILIHPDSLIIANETKVIRARMEFVKESGAHIEIFLLEPVSPHDYATNFASTRDCSWKCLVGNKKRWKDGSLTKQLVIGDEEVSLRASLDSQGQDGSALVVRFEWDNPAFSFAEIVEVAGNIPIPPYLKRQSEESDNTDYQTVYSRTEGSVAAPTAGLHFTPELISELKKYSNEFATVTLHVGAGTFQPVKSEEIGEHQMHSEWISVSKSTISRIISALEEGREILAVGTTSVRTLESLPYFGLLVQQMNYDAEKEYEVTQWMPYEEKYHDFDTIRALKSLREYLDRNGLDCFEANTSIMIVPGFRWRIVNRLITNFHQPKSTLLLLVSSFLGKDGDGRETWRRVYDEALARGYRFLSYGDACLFRRGRQPIVLPASKSMVLRAAMISAVRKPGDPALIDKLPEPCDDVRYFVEALKKCMKSATLTDGKADCYIGEGAAPLRFLVAYAASLPEAKVRITCAEGLRRRPILPLLETLTSMEARIEFQDDPSNWHIDILGACLSPQDVNIESSFTSQFLSALLLVSPLWKVENAEELLMKNVDKEKMVSRPYLRLTRQMMRSQEDLVEVEPDWSAAAFFYEFSLITGEDIRIERLVPPAFSLQGDAMVCDIYAALGVNTIFEGEKGFGSALLKFDEEVLSMASRRGFEFDFSDYPDMVPSVAVALCYRRIPFRLHGIGHLRFKESDRLHGLQRNLSLLGYTVEIDKETLVYDGDFRPFEEFPVELDSYGDHRMAMAFYPLERLGMANVNDKRVVSKSFPNFYQQF